MGSGAFRRRLPPLWHPSSESQQGAEHGCAAAFTSLTLFAAKVLASRIPIDAALPILPRRGGVTPVCERPGGLVARSAACGWPVGV
jgi:hypothetical protein